jgi:hypothetical protein
VHCGRGRGWNSRRSEWARSLCLLAMHSDFKGGLLHYPQQSCQKPWVSRRHHSRRRHLLPLTQKHSQATSERRAATALSWSGIGYFWELLAIRAVKLGRPRTVTVHLVFLPSGCLGVSENSDHGRFVAGLPRPRCAASDAALGKTWLCCAILRRR